MALIDPLNEAWRETSPRAHPHERDDLSLDNFGVVGWVSALSLVEPLVALTWQEAFAHSLHLTLPLSRHVLLFLALWLVYSADHWLDARNASPQAFRTCRHRFAAAHRRSVLSVWCAALVASLGLAGLVLSPQEWAAGLSLVACTLVYLVLVHRFKRGAGRTLAKELWVAGLFAAGSSLFIWANHSLTTGVYAALGLSFLVAWLNLTVIAEREQTVDRLQGTTTIAHCIPRIDRLNRGLAATVILGSACAFISWPRHRALFGSFGACAAALALHRTWLRRMPHERAHVVSDLILLLPIAPFLLGWLA